MAQTGRPKKYHTPEEHVEANCLKSQRCYEKHKETISQKRKARRLASQHHNDLEGTQEIGKSPVNPQSLPSQTASTTNHNYQMPDAITLQDAHQRQREKWKLFVTFMGHRTPLEVCHDICSETIQAPEQDILGIVERHHISLVKLDVGPVLRKCHLAIHKHDGDSPLYRSLLARETEVWDLERDLNLIECEARIDTCAFATKYRDSDLDFQQGFPGQWT